MTQCTVWGAAQGARAQVHGAWVVGVGQQLPAPQRSRRLTLPCLLRLLQQQRQQRVHSPHLHPAALQPPPPLPHPPPPSPRSPQPPSQCPLHSSPYPPPLPFPPRRGPSAHPCPLWRVGGAVQPPRSLRPPPPCPTTPPHPPFATRVQAPLPRLPFPLQQLQPLLLLLLRPVLVALQQRLSAFLSCALPACFFSAPTAPHLALKLHPRSSSSSSSPPPLCPYPSCNPIPTPRHPPAPPLMRTKWGPPSFLPPPFSPPTRAMVCQQRTQGGWGGCLAAQQRQLPCRGMLGGLPAVTPCLQLGGPCCMAAGMRWAWGFRVGVRERQGARAMARVAQSLWTWPLPLWPPSFAVGWSC